MSGTQRDALADEAEDAIDHAPLISGKAKVHVTKDALKNRERRRPGRHGDRATNSYFWHKHGLDRSFLHRARVRLELGGRELEIRSELAPELARVLGAAR